MSSSNLKETITITIPLTLCYRVQADDSHAPGGHMHMTSDECPVELGGVKVGSVSQLVPGGVVVRDSDSQWHVSFLEIFQAFWEARKSDRRAL